MASTNDEMDDYPMLRFHMWGLKVGGIISGVVAGLCFAGALACLGLWLLRNATSDAPWFAGACAMLLGCALILAVFSLLFFFSRELLLVFVRIELNTRR